MKKSFRLIFVLGFLILLCKITVAAHVDTLLVASPAMDRTIKNVVILPDAYDGKARFPVIYLLHGYGANHLYWSTRVPEIQLLADRYGVILVCPDGDKGSWYWDSPVNSAVRFETYITAELIPFIDTNFKTINQRNSRAITGLSMGGQGALFLAFRHQNLFAAAGSMAGGLDIRPFPNNWEMSKHLGSYAEFPERWDAFSVINQIHLLTPKSLQLIIDCGTEDFFYPVNLAFHNKLQYYQIPHTFISKPGKHDLNYWSEAVHYQILFFHKFFSQNQS